MAHYAKVNNGIVETVIVAEAEFFDTFVDSSPGQWIQTSYNTHENQHTLGGTPFRGNYAAVGYIWDSSKNIFYPPKPYNSWVFDDTQAVWQSPIGAAPSITAEQQEQNNAGTHFWAYDWDEENQTWNLINTYA